MNKGSTVFAQVLDFLPMHQFRRCVDRYQGNYRVRSFTCFDQYLCMSFAQLTYRESLRDIECCLRAMDKKLYHTGFRGNVSRSTLADANETRDWRIYRDFAQLLILVARDLYAGEDFGVQLDETVYALDASTIDLCLSVFPWARFRKTKSAVKLHTLLDLRGNIPTFIDITDGKVHDVNVLDILIPEAGAIYVMDRGYLDFGRLFSLNQTPAFFIIRSKTNTKLRRLYSHPVEISCGLRCDQTVVLTGYNSRRDYPQKLRRIRYFDEQQALQLIFLTNHFTLPALTIADLYRCRWQVELFFKWIKQHLRIKAFFGTSENAVKTQIWIAISVYVLVAILKKRLRIEHSLYTILQLLSLTLFEKIPLQQLLTMTSYRIENDYQHIQLNLFET
jgi:transposase